MRPHSDRPRRPAISSFPPPLGLDGLQCELRWLWHGGARPPAPSASPGSSLNGRRRKAIPHLMTGMSCGDWLVAREPFPGRMRPRRVEGKFTRRFSG